MIYTCQLRQRFLTNQILHHRIYSRKLPATYNRRNFDSPAVLRRSAYGRHADSHMFLFIDNMEEQIKQRNTSFGIKCSPICKSYIPAYLAAQGAVRTLRSINISGDRAPIPSPVNNLSPKTWRFVTRFTS